MRDVLRSRQDTFDKRQDPQCCGSDFNRHRFEIGTAEMNPRITVITLGVSDLEASLRFYRDGLGFPTQGIVGQEFEHGSVVFIDLQPGLRLALWPRSSIGHDTGLPVEPPNATEMTLGHNVASREEVDSVMATAKEAGAVIVKPAHDTFWGGYSGYFQDPDGHLWEVVWNPQWTG
jgi:catechol 2,3-dioxygenase-like lactoylglutathione lyase family enzyme